MFFSNTQNNEHLLELLETFEKYVKNETTDINLQASIKNSNIKKIEEKIISISNHLKKEKQEDLKVFGEIMLVCEKLSDGYTDDSITQKTSDEKLNYVAYSINQAITRIENSLEKVITTLKAYEKNDYRGGVDETLFRGGQFKNLLCGIWLCNIVKDSR